MTEPPFQVVSSVNLHEIFSKPLFRSPFSLTGRGCPTNFAISDQTLKTRIRGGSYNPSLILIPAAIQRFLPINSALSLLNSRSENQESRAHIRARRITPDLASSRIHTSDITGWGYELNPRQEPTLIVPSNCQWIIIVPPVRTGVSLNQTYHRGSTQGLMVSLP